MPRPGINELIRRVEAIRPPPPDDLLNGPHRLCECGQPGCGCPIVTPKRLA